MQRREIEFGQSKDSLSRIQSSGISPVSCIEKPSSHVQKNEIRPSSGTRYTTQLELD